MADKGEIQFVTGSFGEEPVRLVSDYCTAFRDWVRAISEAVERGDFDWDENMKEKWRERVEVLQGAEIDIRKSNLLYRLIYLGEQLRTEKCPRHKGRWSGYGWGHICACQDYEDGGYGPDLTGWLPVKKKDDC